MNKAAANRTAISRRKWLSLAGLLLLCYPLLKFIRFKTKRKPKFVEVNKEIALTGFLVTTDFILFDRKGKCWAVSRHCTHLGCRLNYIEDKDILECPCHSSKFSATTGEVLHGPAKRAVSLFPAEKRDSAPFYVVTV